MYVFLSDEVRTNNSNLTNAKSIHSCYSRYSCSFFYYN